MGPLFMLFLVVTLLLGQAAGVANPRGLGVCTTFVLPESSYACYELMVETRDGYRLALQRVNHNASTTPSLGPVFLYHGLMQGGDIWVLNEVDESLAFVLADAGYDVFIGSGRSSIFSSHNLFPRSDSRFWEWGLDDLVVHDLPDMLSYINMLTDKKVLFVGYSQGCQVALAALSSRGNRASTLIEKAVLLAPVAYLGNVQTPALTWPARGYADQALLQTGIAEFSLANANGRQLLSSVCRMSSLDCMNNILNIITGPNCCVNGSRVSYYSMYELQSTSVRNIAHLAQLIRSKRFAKYDYGVVANMERYGSVVPPAYSIANIPEEIPFLLCYGARDALADEADVQRLIRELHRSNVGLVFVGRYAHADFVLSTTAYEEVYVPVLDFLRENQSRLGR